VEILPSLPLLGTLLVLAVVDGTSIGTLGLPVWMLAQPRVRPQVVTTYLFTLAAFYWVLGVVIMQGLRLGLPALEGFGDTTAAAWVQLGIGAALFLASFLFDGPIGRWRRERQERRGKPSAWKRFRTTIVGPTAHAGAAVRVALAAGAIEAISMVPYLAAIGLLTANNIGAIEGAAILIGYCVVMVLPAIVLFALRMAFARACEPTLTRLSRWFERTGNEIVAWTIRVIGYLLVGDGVGRLHIALEASRT